METAQNILEVGDKIVQTHAFGKNVYTIDRVTKTQAIHFNKNGYPIRFRREYDLYSDGSAWITRVPREQWDTSNYQVIKASNE